MKIAGQACCDSRWGKRLRLFLGVVTLFGCAPSATDLQNPVPSSEVERIYEPLVGKDGDLTVTNPNTVLNSYSTLGLGAMAGDKTITVGNILDLNDPVKGKPLGAGDLLLIYQAQGATIDATDDSKKYGTVTALNGAGSFEFVTVESLSGNIITLGGSCGGLRHPYPSGGKAQVVRVPQFLNLDHRERGLGRCQDLGWRQRRRGGHSCVEPDPAQGLHRRDGARLSRRQGAEPVEHGRDGQGDPGADHRSAEGGREGRKHRRLGR